MRRPSRQSILVLGDDSLSQVSSGNFMNHSAVEMMHSIENGQQHREMAVDVPETFIAQNKTQPRYPPPRTLNNQNSLSMPSKGTSSMHDMRPVPIPPPRDHTRADSLHLYQNNKGKIGQVLEPTDDQMDSIKKYQDQLRVRREKEERLAAASEFLRNSVRGSEKLRALTKEDHIAPPPAGFDNEAYVVNEDDTEDDDVNNKINLIGKTTSHAFIQNYSINVLTTFFQ